LKAYASLNNWRPEAAVLLVEILHRGEIARGDAEVITGLRERTSRDLLGVFLADGMVGSDSPKGPISLFVVLLFGARVLSISPKDCNARLLALMCFDSACAVLLSRHEMSPWIPDALRIDVGVLRLPMQIARNLTPGLLMIFVYSLFQDQERVPRWLLVALPVVDEDERTAAAIRAALGEQHLYHDGELTIASLAAQLSVPEYRVRKSIHEQLGYRNFNALLHDYRIAEACRDLNDPKKDHLPILTIALTVGYNSINPFNRAFRDLKGTTPSAFRAEAQQKTSPNPAK